MKAIIVIILFFVAAYVIALVLPREDYNNQSERMGEIYDND